VKSISATKEQLAVLAALMLAEGWRLFDEDKIAHR
jgi:hypothetical protein